MRDEHMLMYVLVFVLGFMVSRMMGDQLIEGDEKDHPKSMTSKADRNKGSSGTDVSKCTKKCSDYKDPDYPDKLCEKITRSQRLYDEDKKENCCDPPNCNPSYGGIDLDGSGPAWTYVHKCCKIKFIPDGYTCDPKNVGKCKHVQDAHRRGGPRSDEFF